MSRILSLLTIALLAGSMTAADRPNIVFIMADDLGINDLSCYGRKDQKTPHLDKLAADGMRFTNAYAACPVCSPTRAAIMTGLHPRPAAHHDVPPRPTPMPPRRSSCIRRSTSNSRSKRRRSPSI